MSTLRLVHSTNHVEPPQAPDRQGWSEPVLDIPGLPPPTMVPMGGPTDDELDLPVPDEDFQVMLDQVDDLFTGLDPQERAKVGTGFYIDADGRPRTRHGQLRAVN